MNKPIDIDHLRKHDVVRAREVFEDGSYGEWEYGTFLGISSSFGDYYISIVEKSYVSWDPRGWEFELINRPKQKLPTTVPSAILVTETTTAKDVVMFMTLDHRGDWNSSAGVYDPREILTWQIAKIVKG